MGAPELLAALRRPRRRNFGSCLDEKNSLGPSSTRVEEASFLDARRGDIGRPSAGVEDFSSAPPKNAICRPPALTTGEATRMAWRAARADRRRAFCAESRTGLCACAVLPAAPARARCQRCCPGAALAAWWAARGRDAGPVAFHGPLRARIALTVPRLLAGCGLAETRVFATGFSGRSRRLDTSKGCAPMRLLRYTRPEPTETTCWELQKSQHGLLQVLPDAVCGGAHAVCRGLGSPHTAVGPATPRR